MTSKIKPRMLKILHRVHKTQVKTLCALTIGAMRGKQLGIAAIGRHIPGSAVVKYKIKRVDRFLGNDRIPLVKCWKSLVRQFIGDRGRIFVAVDWSKINGVKNKDFLTVGIVTCGRSIPIYMEAYEHPIGKCDMVSEELKFLETVREIVPEKVEIVFISDRGFCGRERIEKIEETFRDEKGVRDGLKLKGLRLSTCGRYNRMFLIFGFAYAFLTFLGVWAESEGIDRSIRANTSKDRAFALWRLGQYCFKHLFVSWQDIVFGMKNIQYLE